MKAALEQGLAEFGKVDIVVAQAGIAGMKGEPPTAGVDRRHQHQPGRHHQRDPGRAAAPHRGRLDHRDRFDRGADGHQQEVDKPGKDLGGVAYVLLQARTVRSSSTTWPPSWRRAASAPTSLHPTNCNTDMLQSEPMYRSFRPDLEHPTRADAEPVFGVQQAMKMPYIEPEDISNMVLFLASDESRYVTGMQLRVDAGGYLKWYDFHI